ncbi:MULTISPECIES: DUF6210 family protein [unclassified Streptomyces]|uniref:DUF6210 family protein n=1 Tax=unclassified Streptomyces TaxID=2593676 RepID=UPI00131A4450|nr:DUF6210 family protein [Streptomyces sp. BoleA5]MYX33047.1 hypothetical protein [Streptomyces sp. SID8377]
MARDRAVRRGHREGLVGDARRDRHTLRHPDPPGGVRLAGARPEHPDGTSEQPHALRVDESRIRDADEAWIPVITPDGPAVLVWFNSD